jgi:ketosteroid isomerase-like protein
MTAQARHPEDLARLFVERANAADAKGMSELYEPEAVLAFPPGGHTVGRDAIRVGSRWCGASRTAPGRASSTVPKSALEFGLRKDSVRSQSGR